MTRQQLDQRYSQLCGMIGDAMYRMDMAKAQMEAFKLEIAELAKVTVKEEENGSQAKPVQVVSDQTQASACANRHETRPTSLHGNRRRKKQSAN